MMFCVRGALAARRGNDGGAGGRLAVGLARAVGGVLVAPQRPLELLEEMRDGSPVGVVDGPVRMAGVEARRASLVQTG